MSMVCIEILKPLDNVCLFSLRNDACISISILHTGSCRDDSHCQGPLANNCYSGVCHCGDYAMCDNITADMCSHTIEDKYDASCKCGTNPACEDDHETCVNGKCKGIESSAAVGEHQTSKPGNTFSLNFFCISI